jgi:hypothetical protein
MLGEKRCKGDTSGRDRDRVWGRHEVIARLHGSQTGRRDDGPDILNAEPQRYSIVLSFLFYSISILFLLCCIVTCCSVL